VKTFESRMREDTHHYYVDGLTYIRDRDALAIAQEADQLRKRAIEVIEDLMPSMTDWAAKSVARSFLEELKND
jgi:hypothetical protein